MLLIDGQAGIPAPGVSAGGIPQEDELTKQKISPVHGLTVSGPELVTYVDPAFRVEAGRGPVDFVIEQAGLPRGKVAATGLPGDVDNNGRVDVVDALLVVLYILDSSIAIPNNGDISRGDVNSDGRIDTTDLWLILTNYVLQETGARPTPGGKMYWTAEGPPRIQRADLDGSNVEDLVTTGLDGPSGLALDLAAGKMYWTDSGTDRIQRANLDGSNVEVLVTTGLRQPEELVLDVAAGKMYWADWSTGKVQRANLTGSNVEDLVATGPSGPYGLALDISTAGGQAARTATLVPDPSTVVFENDGRWRAFTVRADASVVVAANPDTPRVEITGIGASSNQCPAESEEEVERHDGEAVHLAGCAAGQATVRLRRASDQTLLRTYTFTIEEAPTATPGTGVAKMYWTSRDRIRRGNRDGSRVEDLVTFGSPRGLALDMQGGKMYWNYQGSRIIWRADLDGSRRPHHFRQSCRSPWMWTLERSTGPTPGGIFPNRPGLPWLAQSEGLPWKSPGRTTRRPISMAGGRPRHHRVEQSRGTGPGCGRWKDLLGGLQHR